MPYPAKRTDSLVAEVLDRMSRGETLTDICRDKDIHPATWRMWCREDEELDIAHAHARDAGFDAIADDCLSIADDGSNDYVVKKRPDGSEYDAFDAEHVQRSKLRIDTRLKLLAKWDPKRYGDKTTLEHTDPHGNNPFASLMEAVSANGRPRPETGS